MKQIRFCGAFAMSAMLAFLLMFTGCKKNIAVSGITISSTADTIEVGSTLKLTYTYEPSDATIEGSVWVSSDQAVATVDQSGLVTGVAAGTANIEVTVNGQKTATCAVTVLPKMTGIKLSSNSVTIKVDTIRLLTYTVEPAGAKVYKEEWSSSNDDVVFVDELGYIDAFAEGTALITLKVNDQFTDTCRVTVEKNLPAMTGITISSEAETIDVGSTVKLSYTVEPAEAKVESAIWSSSDSSVATVDQSGLVTAIGVGNATIIITVNGAFAKACAVRVQAKDPLDEFIEIGRYVGMDSEDVMNDLVKKGWTNVSTTPQILYSKTISGNTATLEMWSSGVGGNCYGVKAGFADTNYYEDGKYLFNKMTASYTFPTISVTAGFSGATMKKADSTQETKSDYLVAQGCIVSNSYVAFNATWTGPSNYKVQLVCTNETKNGIFTIEFGQVTE